MLIFVAFLGGMSYMTILGYTDGDASYMLAPIDSNGQVCGYGVVADYPYLYVPDLAAAVEPISGYFNYGVCANSCPEGPDSTISCY
jgi:hypothetical protein